MWEFIKNNPGWCLGALYVGAEIVVRLTPSKKDDAVFDIIGRVFRKYIPSLKKGGGKF